MSKAILRPLSIVVALLVMLAIVQVAFASSADVGKKLRGLKLMKQGKYDEALKEFKDLSQKHDDVQMGEFAAFHMGVVKHKMYKQTWEPMKKRYLKIQDKEGIEAAESDLGKNKHLATAKSQRADAVKAYQDFASAIPNSALVAGAKKAIADMNVDAEDYATAINQYDELIRSYPGTKYASHAQYRKGVCYFGQGNYSQARTAFQKVLTDDPHSPYARLAKKGLAEAGKAGGATAKRVLP